MRDIVDSAKLAFVATVNLDGSPNLSPKASVRVYDDNHVAFMDIASPGTIANLSVNPRIEIAVAICPGPELLYYPCCETDG